MFGFTPNGTSLCLDLDNEIPADIAEKTFTQEQVDALGTSTEDASYNSLTLYVKVNGTIPEFDTVKQHYVNASGKDVAMMVNADTNKNPKVWDSATWNGDKTGRLQYDESTNATYMKLSLYAFKRATTSSDWELINGEATDQIIEFSKDGKVVARLTVDSPLDGYTVASTPTTEETVTTLEDLKSELSNVETVSTNDDIIDNEYSE